MAAMAAAPPAEWLGHDVFVGSRTRPPGGNPFVVCREGSFDLGFF
jgi:hypothetical protein